MLDRDTKFTDQLHRILGDAGVTTVRTAFHAPHMNAIAERYLDSLKRECLHRLILFGNAHLRQAHRQYVAHYNTERPHQGIGTELIEPQTTTHPGKTGPIAEHERLDGLLRSVVQQKQAQLF
ncbi:MAG: integrase core domain-containing protein [Planctomycetota bacterium]